MRHDRKGDAFDDRWHPRGAGFLVRPTLYEAEELRHNLQHAAEHADLSRRSGRFPHRNAALGRASTAEQQAHLRQGGKLVGQLMPKANEG
jgi:Bacterial protein of unknown function (DUF924)